MSKHFLLIVDDGLFHLEKVIDLPSDFIRLQEFASERVRLIELISETRQFSHHFNELTLSLCILVLYSLIVFLPLIHFLLNRCSLSFSLNQLLLMLNY